jgi:hypothetical protein
MVSRDGCERRLWDQTKKGGYDFWTDITTVGAFRETPLQNSYIRSATPKDVGQASCLPRQQDTRPTRFASANTINTIAP